MLVVPDLLVIGRFGKGLVLVEGLQAAQVAHLWGCSSKGLIGAGSGVATVAQRIQLRRHDFLDPQ
jgi:hypothetical protein